MSEEESFVYSQPTTEHKLAFREAQFQLSRVRENASNEVRKAEENVMNTIKHIGVELNIPADRQTVFNVDTMTFSDQK